MYIRKIFYKFKQSFIFSLLYPIFEKQYNSYISKNIECINCSHYTKKKIKLTFHDIVLCKYCSKKLSIEEKLKLVSNNQVYIEINAVDRINSNLIRESMCKNRKENLKYIFND